MAVIWVIAFAVFLVIETMTLEFTCLSIALACLLGAGAAAIGLPVGLQIGLVAVGSVAALFALAPFLRRHWTPRDTATGNDLIVGSEAEVVEAIAPPAQGKVKLNGVVWQAVSSREIPPGTRVLITELNGARLTVVAKDQVLNMASNPVNARLAPEPPSVLRPEAQQDPSH